MNGSSLAGGKKFIILAQVIIELESLICAVTLEF